jgi:hypothetical protein
LRLTIAQLTERLFDQERGYQQTAPTIPVIPVSRPGTPPAMSSSPIIRHTTLLGD